MSDLIQEKMEIAKRAGELHEDINGLKELLFQVKTKKQCNDHVRINLNDRILNTYAIDRNDFYLHHAIIEYLEVQIDKRHQELDELIKILK